MPTPRRTHPSNDESEGAMLMISHSRLKLPDDDIGDIDDIDINDGGRATVFQTSLNITKICMGTGTLALPFASEVGGLLFNAIGLFAIGAWNYYSANCLLRCLEYLPPPAAVAVGSLGGRGIDRVDEVGVGERGGDSDDGGGFGGDGDIAILRRGKPGARPLGYGTDDFVVDGTSVTRRRRRCDDEMPPPPPGSTTYGRVAWYASGPEGTPILFLFDHVRSFSS